MSALPTEFQCIASRMCDATRALVVAMDSAPELHAAALGWMEAVRGLQFDAQRLAVLADEHADDARSVLSAIPRIAVFNLLNETAVYELNYLRGMMVAQLADPREERE